MDQDMQKIIETVNRMAKRLEHDEWRKTLIETVQKISEGLDLLQRQNQHQAKRIDDLEQELYNMKNYKSGEPW